MENEKRHYHTLCASATDAPPMQYGLMNGNRNWHFATRESPASMYSIYQGFHQIIFLKTC
jgi:hypothetical protein